MESIEFPPLLDLSGEIDPFDDGEHYPETPKQATESGTKEPVVHEEWDPQF